MKILVIGGSGNISWHCVKLFSEMSHDVWVLNRRCTLKTRRSIDTFPIHILQADIHDRTATEYILQEQNFDVVLDFICYKPVDAHTAVKLLKGKTKQYIFISSGANYDRRVVKYPITEDAKLESIGWQYAADKITCENIFLQEHKQNGFPVTIIRPGHTYDTLLPDAVGNGDWTNARRLLTHKPILIHGDGTNLWTITHSADLASGIATLLLNEKAIGQCYHITSDEVLNWRDITAMLANALNVKDPEIIYIPSEKILQADYTLGIGLIGHKMWPDVYDNSKIKKDSGGWNGAQKSAEQGVYESVQWLLETEQRQRVNTSLDQLIDTLCRQYR